MLKKILVTGATGNIAGYVIPQLSAKGIKVNAFVHNKTKAENIKLKGVEIFEGDFTDYNMLNAAAKGTDAVLSITQMNPNAAIQASAILRAAKLAGTKFILRISALKAAKDAPTDNGRLHFQTDNETMTSGIPYTILRPSFYMQNLFMSVPTIKEQGNIYMAMGKGKIGMIDIRDIADSVVSIFVNGGHEEKIYTLTGPATIDFNEIANIITKKLGRTVNYVQVPFEAVSEPILKMGMDKWVADCIVDYAKAYTNNWGNFITDDFQKLTGKKPRSFEKFFDEILSNALKQEKVRM